MHLFGLLLECVKVEKMVTPKALGALKKWGGSFYFLKMFSFIFHFCVIRYQLNFLTQDMMYCLSISVKIMWLHRRVALEELFSLAPSCSF